MEVTLLIAHSPSHVILDTPWTHLGLVPILLVWLQEFGVTQLPQDAT